MPCNCFFDCSLIMVLKKKQFEGRFPIAKKTWCRKYSFMLYEYLKIINLKDFVSKFPKQWKKWQFGRKKELFFSKTRTNCYLLAGLLCRAKVRRRVQLRWVRGWRGVQAKRKPRAQPQVRCGPSRSYQPLTRSTKHKISMLNGWKHGKNI